MNADTLEYIASKGLVPCVAMFGQNMLMISVAPKAPPETFDPDNFKCAMIGKGNPTDFEWTPPEDAKPLQPFPIEVLGEDLSALGMTLDDVRDNIDRASKFFQGTIVAVVELGTHGKVALASRE